LWANLIRRTLGSTPKERDAEDLWVNLMRRTRGSTPKKRDVEDLWVNLAATARIQKRKIVTEAFNMGQLKGSSDDGGKESGKEKISEGNVRDD
jgi:hypothetical protein